MILMNSSQNDQRRESIINTEEIDINENACSKFTNQNKNLESYPSSNCRKKRGKGHLHETIKEQLMHLRRRKQNIMNT